MDAAGVRILIVDDDAASRRLLDVRLRALGCDTIMAADGQEALATLRQEPPALMLLDLQMPRMGGIEVLRALRRDALDLPVIVITAHGSVEAAVEAMREGAHDFLPKPFDPHHLEIVVRKAWSTEGSSRPTDCCGTGWTPAPRRSWATAWPSGRP